MGLSPPTLLLSRLQVSKILNKKKLLTRRSYFFGTLVLEKKCVAAGKRILEDVAATPRGPQSGGIHQGLAGNAEPQDHLACAPGLRVVACARKLQTLPFWVTSSL